MFRSRSTWSFTLPHIHLPSAIALFRYVLIARACPSKATPLDFKGLRSCPAMCARSTTALPTLSITALSEQALCTSSGSVSMRGNISIVKSWSTQSSQAAIFASKVLAKLLSFWASYISSPSASLLAINSKASLAVKGTTNRRQAPTIGTTSFMAYLSFVSSSPFQPSQAVLLKSLIMPM